MYPFRAEVGVHPVGIVPVFADPLCELCEQTSAHYRQLIRRGAVDDVVRRVDVGDDVAQFAAADIVPVLERLAWIIGALTSIANHPPHQP